MRGNERIAKESFWIFKSLQKHSKQIQQLPIATIDTTDVTNKQFMKDIMEIPVKVNYFAVQRTTILGLEMKNISV